MAKREFRNSLNDLAPKEWLKFQKSWFVHNPPRRQEDVLLHPAKFPETLAAEFICFFTKAGETVLDPMVGTGSALVAALECGRHAVGVELLKRLVKHRRRRQPQVEDLGAAGGQPVDQRVLERRCAATHVAGGQHRRQPLARGTDQPGRHRAPDVAHRTQGELLFIHAADITRLEDAHQR